MQLPFRFTHKAVIPKFLRDSLKFPDLFRLMKPDERQRLFENTARAMGDAPKEIKLRHIGNCRKADPAYGDGVAKALGL